MTLRIPRRTPRREHRWHFGKIDGFPWSMEKKKHLTRDRPLFCKQTNQKGHLGARGGFISPDARISHGKINGFLESRYGRMAVFLVDNRGHFWVAQGVWTEKEEEKTSHMGFQVDSEHRVSPLSAGILPLLLRYPMDFHRKKESASDCCWLLDLKGSEPKTRKKLKTGTATHWLKLGLVGPQLPRVPNPNRVVDPNSPNRVPEIDRRLAKSQAALGLVGPQPQPSRLEQGSLHYTPEHCNL